MKLRLAPWIRPRAAIGLLVGCLVLAIAPLLHDDVYTHNLLTLTFIGIAAALAWNWLGGYLGQVSFGHAAMFGIGGFVTARVELSLGLPMVASWIVGGVVAGLFALIWGHPTLRLRGPYFSIATIGVGEATRLVCTYWDSFTGGSSGMSLPVQGNLKHTLYWYGLVLAALALCASYALRRSPMGLALLAIKSDVDAASDVGVSATRLQDLVLFISGSTIGVCGGFYASYFSYIEPGDMFGFDRSISWVLMGVIGGIGTIAGPALGAIIFVLLRQYLIASYPQLYLGLYGLLLVLVILFEPLGLTGLFLRIVHRARPDLAVGGPVVEQPAAATGVSASAQKTGGAK
jgi:branched-chain amino acid transport system permease protein